MTEIKVPNPKLQLITDKDLLAEIDTIYFFTAEQGCLGANDPDLATKGHGEILGMLTFCVIVLKNGFTTEGSFSWGDPTTYDETWCQLMARVAAEQKLWPFLGYKLLDKVGGRKGLSKLYRDAADKPATK